MGSGFDTRAYRVPGVKRAPAFELDAPATLQIERERIEALPGVLASRAPLRAAPRRRGK
jgi:O-methyltransferase involved in polyketide biosynthesis